MQAGTLASLPPAPLSPLSQNGHSHDHASPKDMPNGCSATDADSLKRTYLRLLPPVQLIELCLSFEAYAPPHVKSALWPGDLRSAISQLQSVGSSETRDVSSSSSVVDDAPLMDSLRASTSPRPALHDTESRDDQQQSPGAGPSTLSTDTNAAAGPSLSASPAPDASSTSPSTSNSIPSQSLPQSQPQPQLQHQTQPQPQPQPQPQLAPQLPYTHTPYGYAHSSYPHNPYYTLPHTAAAYPPPYTYYPYPSSHYAAPPADPNTSSAPPASSIVHESDLPSYEDMLVEALTECTEPDGLQPKNIFLWMAARYPLQSNFRPSASQALQKAFRRGRLVKSSGGRYKLNVNWEGGSTSKRATRRPQTYAQVHCPPPPDQKPPPFTNAPLSQRSSPAPGSHPPPHAAHPHHAQPYPWSWYTGYNAYALPSHHPQPQPHVQQPAQPVAVANGSANGASHDRKTDSNKAQTGTHGSTEGAGEEEEVDAWEAAREILKAINFGSLIAQSEESSAAANTHAAEASALTGRPHVNDTSSTAGSNVNMDAGTDTDISMEQFPSPAVGRTELTDEERESLQAQLKGLAALLDEIADYPDEENEDDTEGEEV